MKKSLLLNLALMLCCEFAIAQTTVSGTVVDTNGNPMPGAKVQVKGTKEFTITNMDGTFSVNSPKPKFKLVSNYVGWNTEVMKAKDGMVIKMGKSDWWHEKPTKWQWFLGVNAAFPGTGETVFSGVAPGIMFGKVKNYGWYCKLQTNGDMDEHYCHSWTTGKTTSTYTSATAGLLFRLGCPIHLYLGFGMMESKVGDKLVCGGVVEREDEHIDGMLMDVGTMIRYHRFFVQAGVQLPYGHRDFEDGPRGIAAGTFGIGYCF